MPQNPNGTHHHNREIQEAKDLEPEKNSLMALRDKLLEHRKKSTIQNEG
jgi:hypothetical protein